MKEQPKHIEFRQLNSLTDISDINLETQGDAGVETEVNETKEIPKQTPETEKSESDAINVKGMAYAVAANIAFSLQAPVLKILMKTNQNITPYEIMYWYMILMIGINYSWVRMHGEFVLNVPKRYRNIIVFRALIGFSGVQGKVAALKYMPVSTSTCIFFTLPIWATLGAYLVLKEKIDKFDIAQLAISFMGVLVINNPFESHAEVEHAVAQGTHNYTKGDLLIGSLFSLSGAIGGSMAVLCMRYMKVGIHYSISPFWFASGSAFWSPIFHGFYRSTSTKYTDLQTGQYDLQTKSLIVLTAIFATLGQNFSSKAYQLEKTSRVAATSYLNIVIAFLWDILVFQETLTFQDILGSSMIVGIFVTITCIKSQKK